MIALAMSEEDDINYQEFATEDEDVQGLRALRLTKGEIESLYDLADSMTQQTIRKTRTLIGNPEEKHALKNAETALGKILASYTRMHDISKKDRDECEQELADLTALFHSACNHKDLDTLSWLYFKSLKEYTEPDPEPVSVTKISANVFALPTRKAAEESDETTELEVESMKNMLDLSKPLVPEKVLENLGQFASYETLSDDRQSQINNMAHCATVIGFIRALQESIANHLNGRVAIAPKAEQPVRGFTPRVVR